MSNFEPVQTLADEGAAIDPSAFFLFRGVSGGLRIVRLTYSFLLHELKWLINHSVHSLPYISPSLLEFSSREPPRDKAYWRKCKRSHSVSVPLVNAMAKLTRGDEILQNTSRRTFCYRKRASFNSKFYKRVVIGRNILAVRRLCN